MFTLLQTLICVILTAAFVEILTRIVSRNEIENVKLNSNLKSKFSDGPNTEILNPFGTFPQEEPAAAVVREPEEVTKLLDAIFVSHGIEGNGNVNDFNGGLLTNSNSISDSVSESVSMNMLSFVSADADEPVNESVNESVNEPINESVTEPVNDNFVSEPSSAIPVADSESPPKPSPTPIIELNSSNFNSVYHEDWLILAHVPWYPISVEYLEHFKSVLPISLSLSNSSLKIAVLDCHSYPRLAGLLNIRSYPSLRFVTSSSKLREWPFDLQPFNNETIQFLLNRDWVHLPAFQILKSNESKKGHSFIVRFTEMQIEAYNNAAKFWVFEKFETQVKMFNFILNRGSIA